LQSNCARLKNDNNGGVSGTLEACAMLAGIWLFLKEPANLPVLSSIGVGIATIAAGAWAVFTFFAKKKETGPSAPSVTADHGSVAAGRDITAPVTINPDAKEVVQQVCGPKRALR
jgi:threonine/homoserine efflux transporter RhtA